MGLTNIVVVVASKDKNLNKENKIDNYIKNNKPTMTYYYPKSGVQSFDTVRSNGIIDQYRNFTSYTDPNFKNILGHAVAIGTRDKQFFVMEQTHFLPKGAIMSKIRLINLPNERVNFDSNGFYTPGNYIFPIVDGTGLYLEAKGFIDFYISPSGLGRTVSIYLQ